MQDKGPLPDKRISSGKQKASLEMAYAAGPGRPPEVLYSR
jgi:hypothetical protein